jgi:DnaJ family protein C protein 10
MHAMKCLPFLFLFLLKAASDDYYDLLGISKDAGDRDIRRAFKKLALKLHPDKNQDDPHAHENFLKINRAYEVLKDEELRKKYDTYGEEGLKEDHFGGHYKSWQFYNQEFGWKSLIS